MTILAFRNALGLDGSPLLLAAYSFDENSSTVTDYSGNGNSFILTGTNAARRVAGRTNGGLTKTAADGNPTLPLMGQTANRTVMAWVRGVGEVWWIRWNVTPIASGAWGLLLLSGNVGVQARNASGFVRPSVAAPTDGLWHHYAGTYDGETVRLYVDGVLAASAVLTAPLRTDADVLDIAQWAATPPTTMDDLRILNMALSASEITSLMNTPVTPAVPTGAVRFDAPTDRYGTTIGLPAATVYTALCWFYVSVDRNAYSLIWELQYASRSNVNAVYITGSKAVEFWDINAPRMSHQGAVGVWQRVALAVGTGGNATSYYGTATGPLAVATTAVMTSPTAGDKLLIGNDQGGNQWLNGREAAYKMWNATLTQAEIEREFESYRPVRTANLLRWHPWKVAEATDHSGNGNHLTAGSTETTTEEGPPIPWVTSSGEFFPFFP